MSVNRALWTAERMLSAKVRLTLATGAEVTPDQAEVISFSVDEGSDSPLLPGAVLSAKYVLELANDAGQWRWGGSLRGERPLVGATAQLFVTAAGEDIPCGTFIVDSVSADEGGGVVRLSGSDSIAHELAGEFVDETVYPATLAQIWENWLIYTPYAWSGELPNGDMVIPTAPNWKWRKVSLRRAAGWIAQAAGCFVRVSRTGALEVVPCMGGGETALSPDDYMTLSDGFDTFGPVRTVVVEPVNDDEAVVEASDGPGAAVRIEGNPLFTSGRHLPGMARAVLDTLSGLTLAKAELRWRGDPAVGVGDGIALTDTAGETLRCTVTRQSLKFDKGFSAHVICAIPESGAGGVARAITLEGGLNAAALVGAVDGGLLRAGSVSAKAIAANVISAGHLAAQAVTAEKIAAEAVLAENLAAGAVTAEKLAAGAVTAEKLHAESVSGEVARFVAAEMEKITAEQVETDALYAAFAHLIVLAAGSISAGDVQADRLAAALAEFVSLHAKTGEFDFATIQNLVAQALALEQGSMDTVYIKNLAVTSANLLSATLGKLVLKGDDGKYYRVFVGADGGVRTEEVVLTDAEIADGRTEGGQQIVETDMNVGSLNASNLQASSAVINEILTIALTAEKITAADAMIASATIPALYATTIKAIGDSLDLSANLSVRQMVSGKSRIFYQEDAPEEYELGDTWIVPSTGKSYYVVRHLRIHAAEIIINDDFEFVFRYPPDTEELDFLIDQHGDLFANTEHVQLDEEGVLYTLWDWAEIPVSELHTSYIDIMQDVIRIRSGGNVVIGAGGAFNVEAGSAHFKTSDFALSILAEDGSEDTVLDFDAESKTLRVDDLEADNVRPFIAGTTSVTSAEVGGMDGLKGMLEAAQYEHLVYTQIADDLSTEPIAIGGCDSMRVVIRGLSSVRVPPLEFHGVTGNVRLEYLSWVCGEDQTALYADSGNFVAENCFAAGGTGAEAFGNARLAWLGVDESMEDGGVCATAFHAGDGAEIRLYGLIPDGSLKTTRAGTITEKDTRTGTGGGTTQVSKTVSIAGTLGYYGTNSGWNGGAMYQGYTSGKGRIYGCMQFDLPEEVTRIKAATLTLHRVSGAGSGSNVNVTVYESATEFKSRPSLGDQVAHRDKAAGTGESCTLDVTEGAKALLDGTAKQLVLYTGETKTASGVVYSRHYGKFDSAKLKITY